MSYSSDDDEINDLYNEMYDSPLKAKKDLKNSFAKNLKLHERIKLLEKENIDLNILIETLLVKNKTYSQFETYKVQVRKLTQGL